MLSLARDFHFQFFDNISQVLLFIKMNLHEKATRMPNHELNV